MKKIWGYLKNQSTIAMCAVLTIVLLGIGQLWSYTATAGSPEGEKLFREKIERGNELGIGSSPALFPVASATLQQEDCGNGIDDDGDGCIDWADSDCGGLETCHDLIDNNCDGLTDCEDPACEFQLCAPFVMCCYGMCWDTDTDPSNCGMCGNVCSGTTPGCCSGSCKDLDSDNNNCGSCGNVCTGGKTCQNGECSDTTPPTVDIANQNPEISEIAECNPGWPCCATTIAFGTVTDNVGATRVVVDYGGAGWRDCEYDASTHVFICPEYLGPGGYGLCAGCPGQSEMDIVVWAYDAAGNYGADQYTKKVICKAPTAVTLACFIAISGGGRPAGQGFGLLWQLAGVVGLGALVAGGVVWGRRRHRLDQQLCSG
jgi:hypothetical protein